jgi:hypothetical protein
MIDHISKVQPQRGCTCGVRSLVRVPVFFDTSLKTLIAFAAVLTPSNLSLNQSDFLVTML